MRRCAATIAVLAGCVIVHTPAAQQRTPPNVLLITIDTLRADRVGVYGYGGARTPTIDRLAARGVRFADATAHAPLTYPSHVAILTGRYAGSFGVRLNGMDPLPTSAVTLAERFKAAGYSTGAVVASVILDRSSGLSQGFDKYDDGIAAQSGEMVAIADLQRPAGKVTSAARAWLATQKRPWFLWVHYYDPHLPYAAPAKFAALTPGRPYDAEVAYADAEVGQLLQAVDASSTAVVLTSDHGEALGDHGEADHGFFLYDATLHVPLVIDAPGVTPRLVAEQVRSIDVAPTIQDLAGLTATPDADGGESLRPLMEGASRRDVPASLAESWYPRLHFGWSELRSMRVGEWKFVAAPKPELYDLRVDRAEARNVIADRASVAGRLSADLSRIAGRFAQADAPRPAQPDAATVERLQALGYVGSFAPVTAGSATADPKDHLAEYRQYRSLFNSALDALGRGAPAQAAATLQRLLKLNVRAFEAHLYLGSAYAAQGRWDAALGEYDVASQLNPQLSTPHFEAAKALSAKGDFAKAAERCRKGLELEPLSTYGYFTLGVVYQKASQWEDAFAAFSRAVELNGADPRPRTNLASTAMRLGNLDVAEAQLLQVIQLGAHVAPSQYNLGVIAERRGNRDEAARRYRLALEADPTFGPARTALAKLR